MNTSRVLPAVLHAGRALRMAPSWHSRSLFICGTRLSISADPHGGIDIIPVDCLSPARPTPNSAQASGDTVRNDLLELELNLPGQRPAHVEKQAHTAAFPTR